MSKAHTVSIELNNVQIRQLLTYCRWAKDDGEYYGYKPYFDSRHEKMVKMLEDALKAVQ